jgi:ribonuclease HI
MDLANFIQQRLHAFHNMREFIFNICRHGSDFEVSKAAVLMWFIWQNRNNIVWNDSKLSAQQVGVQALTFWNQWATINGFFHEQQQAVLPPTAANNIVQWNQPPFGFLKCNVDASFFNMAGVTGSGWILRDYRGQFQLAGSNIIHASLSVLEGEAMALIEAMEEVIHRGLSFVIFESDSKLMVDAISSRQAGVSDFSILISHIQSLLRLNNYFEVKYVKRQANKVAHSLARAAFSMSRRCIFDSVPPCIDSLLSNELC